MAGKVGVGKVMSAGQQCPKAAGQATLGRFLHVGRFLLGGGEGVARGKLEERPVKETVPRPSSVHSLFMEGKSLQSGGRGGLRGRPVSCFSPSEMGVL